MNPDKFNRYKQFLHESYVEISKSAKWCPGVGCDIVAELKKTDTRVIDINCTSCGKAFCFDCLEDAH